MPSASLEAPRLSTRTAPLARGVFTLSLDFELIWGTLDLFGPQAFRRVCEIERHLVIDRLLSLLEEFELPATWCILGHLFLDSCRRDTPGREETGSPRILAATSAPIPPSTAGAWWRRYGPVERRRRSALTPSRT